MKTRSDDDAQASRQLASSQPPRQAATKTHRAQAGSHAGKGKQAATQAGRQASWRYYPICAEIDQIWARYCA